MAYYKILKTGHFREAHLNEIGAVVDLHPDAARIAVENGFLEPTDTAPEKKEPEAKKETGEHAGVGAGTETGETKKKEGEESGKESGKKLEDKKPEETKLPEPPKEEVKP